MSNNEKLKDKFNTKQKSRSKEEEERRKNIKHEKELRK